MRTDIAHISLRSVADSGAVDSGTADSSLADSGATDSVVADLAPRGSNAMRRQPMFGQIRHVHMVGIAGIGMSSIAEVLLARGYRVTGSDLALSEVTDRLLNLGADVFEGHDAANIEGACVVVHSSAVDPDSNSETVRAKAVRIPVISRSEMLGELMRMKFGIGIAGTHGKTTTTTMAAHVIGAGDFDPTVIVGGKVSAFGSNAVSGEGDIILIEADEYDKTFLRLTPSVAVITNIDADHLECYEDMDDLRRSFLQFASSVPFFGVAIVCLDDENVRGILPQIDRRVLTYGTTGKAQVRAESITQEGRRMHFEVFFEDSLLGKVSLLAPGRHNVLNALAAIAVGIELDIAFEDISRGLSSFTGVERRMHEIGEAGGILVVDDYAHHPTEIRASLEAAAGCWPDRRIVALFQPHLYSRTNDLQEEFFRSFSDAHVLVVMDVYGARETPIVGVSGALIAGGVRDWGHPSVMYEPEWDKCVRRVLDEARENDVIITLGAGDIWRINREIMKTLIQENGAQDG